MSSCILLYTCHHRFASQIFEFGDLWQLGRLHLPNGVPFRHMYSVFALDTFIPLFSKSSLHCYSSNSSTSFSLAHSTTSSANIISQLPRCVFLPCAQHHIICEYHLPTTQVRLSPLCTAPHHQRTSSPNYPGTSFSLAHSTTSSANIISQLPRCVFLPCAQHHIIREFISSPNYPGVSFSLAHSTTSSANIISQLPRCVFLPCAQHHIIREYHLPTTQVCLSPLHTAPHHPRTSSPNYPGASFCLAHSTSSANIISQLPRSYASFLMFSISESIMMAKENGLTADPWWRSTSVQKVRLFLQYTSLQFRIDGNCPSPMYFSPPPLVSHAPLLFFPRDSVVCFFQINEYSVSLAVLLCIFLAAVLAKK